MFAQALARRLSGADIHYGCLAAASIWLIGGWQGARERLVEAQA
jgi:hypothetical protein